uniref:Uncharacterized protein n=1 Tax=Panstrongylus lignarius TaxID=156445 RepID=A0A224Y6Z0_9HEMI
MVTTSSFGILTFSSCGCCGSGGGGGGGGFIGRSMISSLCFTFLWSSRLDIDENVRIQSAHVTKGSPL